MTAEQTRSIRKARPVYKTSNGEVVPGVTTVIALKAKPALVEWAFKLARENPGLRSASAYTDDLARIGTCAHDTIAATLKGEAPDLSDFTQNEIQAAAVPVGKFMSWASDKKIEVLGSEEMVVSDRHRYGGTLDLYVLLDGKRTVLDLKTSRRIYPEMWMQVAAYAEAKREKGVEVEQVGIVQIGRNAEEGFSSELVPTWSNAWNAFLALRALYDIEVAERQGCLWSPKHSPWNQPWNNNEGGES